MAVAVRFLGDWDRALAIAGEVLDDGAAPTEIRIVAEEELGLISALRGDRRRGRSVLRRASSVGRVHEIFGVHVGATWGLAVIADLDDDRDEAGRTVSLLLERCAARQASHFAALPALRWVGTYSAQRGDTDHLMRCHRLLAVAATENSSQKVLSALAHVGAELALADGDSDQAATQFTRSVDLLQGITAPFEQALSQLRLGRALAGVDDRPRAVDAITSAYRTARQLGAKPLARACATELAAMGEHVDQRLGRLAARALSPAGLTRRELEVLRLLATGRTNRQIAGDLFISVRTVDMHVRNVLLKLGCSTRLEAVQQSTQQGII